jgi:hypothetical protein
LEPLPNPLIDPVILAHINLDRLAKEYGGKLTQVDYDPAFYEELLSSRGRIVASLSDILHLLSVNITFSEAACVIAFLAQQSIIITWIAAKSQRRIELQCGDIKIIIQGTNDIEVANRLYQAIANSAIETEEHHDAPKARRARGAVRKVSKR